jgi:hypothetical protein
MQLNYEWQSRIKDVEREYRTARQSVDWFQHAAQRDSTILHRDLSHSDIGLTAKNLEGTYLIRLFAEFETGLRLFWAEIRDTMPPAWGLLEGIASRRKIPHEHLANAHDVQNYRNTLVHERDEETDTIPIHVARSYLCRFFSYLPVQW